MHDTIESTKAEFLHAKQRMTEALSTTPDDRINWSPSPTSRTPIYQVAHAASSVRNITNMLKGHEFPISTPAEANVAFREADSKFHTRQDVLAFLDETSSEFLQWLDQLTPEGLAGVMVAPFGLGQVPISLAMTFPGKHMRDHAAQLEYIQTIYGDVDWHMPSE